MCVSHESRSGKSSTDLGVAAVAEAYGSMVLIFTEKVESPHGPLGLGSRVMFRFQSAAAAQFAAEAINKALELSDDPAPYRLEAAE